MARDPRQHAHEQLMRFARLNGAPALVRERNHAVHVGKIAPDLLRLDRSFT